jgi:hypothetical protein
MKSRHLGAFTVAVVLGLTLLAAPRVHAFTIENQGNADSDGAARLSDPDLNDRQTSRFDSGKQTVIKRGNTTIYLGGQPQSFNQRNDSNSYFSPNVLMGR